MYLVVEKVKSTFETVYCHLLVNQVGLSALFSFNIFNLSCESITHLNNVV